MRRLFAIAAVLASSACVDLVGANWDNKYVERDEKRFSTSGKPEISLRTFDGSIEVKPWDKAEVEVIIEKRGPNKETVAELQIEAAQTGNHISVTVRQPRNMGIHWGNSASARLIVSAPASSDVDARSGDGAIDIEQISGRVTLHSGDGSIRAHNMSGYVDVSTGDGSIDVDGRLSALRAHSGDGGVKIRAAAGSDAGEGWEISTGDGAVSLEIPEGFSGELDARTGDGGVDVRNVALSNVIGEIRRNRVRGRLGSGGPPIKVRTGDGSITIRRP